MSSIRVPFEFGKRILIGYYTCHHREALSRWIAMPGANDYTYFV